MRKSMTMRSWALAAAIAIAAIAGLACDAKSRSYPTQPAARNFENPETSVVTAAFLAQVSEDPEDFTVIFRDLSTGNIEVWSWDFGDKRKSSAQNPVHVYRSPGTYVVTLTVSNSISSDSVSQFVVIADPNAGGTEGAPD